MLYISHAIYNVLFLILHRHLHIYIAITYKYILNIEIRIDDMNKEYFNFLFFTIHAIDIKQNEIITNSIIYHELKWQLNQ